METKGKRFLAILTLGLLAAIGPFSIDMYLPGFEAIAKDLNTTVSHIGMSLSSFFVGIAVGQLIYGPLLDRFGKKRPLYIGLVLYFICSIICAFVVDADSLIVVRFFQAIGSCAGMVASRAFIRDLFPVNENARIFSYLMLVVALSPIVAPTFGGFISGAFGWEAIFIILALIAILTLLASYFWLPAGAAPDKSISLKPKPIIKDFVGVSKEPMFYTYALVSAVSSSGLYAYIAGSPKLFMGIYELSQEHYAWVFAIIAVAMTVASQVNNFFLRKYSSQQITIVALSCQVITGFCLVLFTALGWLELYSTIVVIMLYLATQGFVYPNTSALSLVPFERNAGTASALMGAVQMGIGGLVTALVSAFIKDTAVPMVVAMLLCASISFAGLMMGRRLIKKNEHKLQHSRLAS